MTLEEIRSFCLSLPGTTEDIKWEDHLCFNVGGKMYLITSPDRVPISSSLKTDPEKFDELIERDGIIPAPYLARSKWVQIDNLERLSEEEWKELIRFSYNLVFSKLTKKSQRKLTS